MQLEDAIVQFLGARHIKRFGPAILFATRQAPSVDIARSFIHVHIVRHLVSGGLLPDPSFEGDKRRTAGTQVLALADDFGLGYFVPLASGAACTWQDTKASRVPGVNINQQLITEKALLRCRSVELKNGDIARPLSYVIYTENGRPLVARVEEILALPESKRLLAVVVAPVF